MNDSRNNVSKYSYEKIIAIEFLLNGKFWHFGKNSFAKHLDKCHRNTTTQYSSKNSLCNNALTQTDESSSISTSNYCKYGDLQEAETKVSKHFIGMKI